jgi:hypothetical protein
VTANRASEAIRGAERGRHREGIGGRKRTRRSPSIWLPLGHPAEINLTGGMPRAKAIPNAARPNARRRWGQTLVERFSAYRASATEVSSEVDLADPGPAVRIREGNVLEDESRVSVGAPGGRCRPRMPLGRRRLERRLDPLGGAERGLELPVSEQDLAAARRQHEQAEREDGRLVEPNAPRAELDVRPVGTGENQERRHGRRRRRSPAPTWRTTPRGTRVPHPRARQSPA